MSERDEPLPGTTGVLGALGGAILVALLLLLARPVQLDDAGRPVAGQPVALLEHAVDLNTAGPDELVLLPGIGPALSERIAADRRRRGAFRSLDDLRRVDGVGAATVARIRPHVVGPDTP